MALGSAVLALFVGCAHTSQPSPSSGIKSPHIESGTGQPPPLDAAAIEARRVYYMGKAKATYPDARARFIAGLPQSTTFLVARTSSSGTEADSFDFVVVDRIEAGLVIGHEWQGPDAQAGSGRAVRFPETDVVDWQIHHPDGSDEGWYTGKYLYEVHTGKPAIE